MAGVLTVAGNLFDFGSESDSSRVRSTGRFVFKQQVLGFEELAIEVGSALQKQCGFRTAPADHHGDECLQQALAALNGTSHRQCLARPESLIDKALIGNLKPAVKGRYPAHLRDNALCAFQVGRGDRCGARAARLFADDAVLSRPVVTTELANFRWVSASAGSSLHHFSTARFVTRSK
jgi:hypothetical protein